MDADADWMSAKSLKAHKREGAAASKLAKKVRVEETDLTVFLLDGPEPTLMSHLRSRGLPGVRHREEKSNLRKKVMPAITVRGNLTSERRSCLPSS